MVDGGDIVQAKKSFMGMPVSFQLSLQSSIHRSNCTDFDQILVAKASVTISHRFARCRPSNW